MSSASEEDKKYYVDASIHVYVFIEVSCHFRETSLRTLSPSNSHRLENLSTYTLPAPPFTTAPMNSASLDAERE